MRLLKRFLMTMLLCIAGLPTSYAVGLGEVVSQSSYGENLEVSIALTGASATALAVTEAGLATQDEYLAERVAYPPYAAVLRFSVEQGASGYTLSVTTTSPFSEKYIQLLLFAETEGVRDVRRYIIFLESPIETKKAPETEVVVESNSRVDDTKASGEQKSDSPGSAPSTARSSTQPVTVIAGPGDALSGIIRRLGLPDAISIYQGLVAVFEANPGAFYGQNMNRLIVGEKITIPPWEEIEKTDALSAVVKYKEQANEYEQWLEGGSVAELGPTEAPVNETSVETATEAETSIEVESVVAAFEPEGDGSQLPDGDITTEEQAGSVEAAQDIAETPTRLETTPDVSPVETDIDNEVKKPSVIDDPLGPQTLDLPEVAAHSETEQNVSQSSNSMMEEGLSQLPVTADEALDLGQSEVSEIFLAPKAETPITIEAAPNANDDLTIDETPIVGGDLVQQEESYESDLYGVSESESAMADSVVNTLQSVVFNDTQVVDQTAAAEAGEMEEAPSRGEDQQPSSAISLGIGDSVDEPSVADVVPVEAMNRPTIQNVSEETFRFPQVLGTVFEVVYDYAIKIAAVLGVVVLALLGYRYYKSRGRRRNRSRREVHHDVGVLGGAGAGIDYLTISPSESDSITGEAEHDREYRAHFSSTVATDAKETASQSSEDNADGLSIGGEPENEEMAAETVDDSTIRFNDTDNPSHPVSEYLDPPQSESISQSDTAVFSDNDVELAPPHEETQKESELTLEPENQPRAIISHDVVEETFRSEYEASEEPQTHLRVPTVESERMDDAKQDAGASASGSADATESRELPPMALGSDDIVAEAKMVEDGIPDAIADDVAETHDAQPSAEKTRLVDLNDVEIGDSAPIIFDNMDADEQDLQDPKTALELAHAYSKLGDKDVAQGFIDEVMKNGTDEQKEEAQALAADLT